MGIPIFPEILEIEFRNSSLLTGEHVSLTAQQERRYRIQKKLNNIKDKIKRERQEFNREKLTSNVDWTTTLSKVLQHD